METETLALPLIIKKGEFVIDIGAHVGFYTKDLATIVGEGGLVWSIEPMPQTFDILAYEIRKFRWANVQAFKVAISDSEGSEEMEIPRFKGGGESWADARVYSPETRHSNWRSFTVRTVTLDSLTAKMDRPISFIKCDAEFHELQCLHGATETIRRWHPAFLIETIDDPYRNASNTETIVHLLSDFGYTAYIFDGKDFRVRKPNEQSQNTFFFFSSSDTTTGTSARP